MNKTYFLQAEIGKLRHIYYHIHIYTGSYLHKKNRLRGSDFLGLGGLGFRGEKSAPFPYRRCRNGGQQIGHWSSRHVPR